MQHKNNNSTKKHHTVLTSKREHLSEREYNTKEVSSRKKGSQNYFYNELKDVNVDAKSLDNLAMSNLETITRGCNANKNSDDRFR